jgi:choice-of-anchor B domain-containing protein
MKKISSTFCLLLISLFALAQPSKNIVERDHMRFPGKVLSNICGYVDSLNNEYALVGTSTGMTIVDVTNPDSSFQVASFPGPNSIWREIKTWQHYAYVTTEGGGGLQIVDMRNLPGTNLPFKNWTPTISNETLGSIHALHIDAGYVYLYGSNIGNKGIVIANLIDPWNPVYEGLFDNSYVHDGYVRNDTVWAGQIYAGTFSAIDVSNKSNPTVIGLPVQTPSAFTHNTWLSDNSRYLFTTDEVNNSYLAVYDVSDALNIQLVDKIQSQNPGSQSIVHNTHIRNDYAITSWYKDGFVITDGHRPQNLVNVGYIDSSPLSGGGFDGVWGVYPFFPSGTIVTSDIDSGLYVYTPTYVRACYLEGVVRDSSCNTLLNNVQVSLMGTNVADSTDFTGNYKTGTPDSGNYMAVFSKAGYTTKTVPVNLSNGVVTIVDVQMVSNSTVNLNGFVNDLGLAVTLPNANVTLSNSNGTYALQSDNTGSFNNCATVAGVYNVVSGKWGYETICFNTLISQATSNLNISLQSKIQDDFSFDYGWTTSSTATSGSWERGVPIGTSFVNTNDANPGADVSSDCSDKAFVTGNGGGAASSDDIDNGAVYLNSPIFDLTGYSQPIIKYSRWFFNGGGSGGPNDSMHVLLSNGTNEIELEFATVNSTLSTWVNKTINITGLIPVTATMQLRVIAADVLPGHLVEAGFDNFSVENGTVGIADNSNTSLIFTVAPNPSNDQFILSGFNTKNLNEQSLFVIRDISGRIIEQADVTEDKIFVGKNLTAGIYFVTLISNGKNTTQKIVKY